MGKSKIRTLLTASVMIMLCAATIVGGTYALWSDNTTAETHLSAGNLEVELKRTGLSKTYLDIDGYLKTETLQNTVDFTSDTDENVFGIGNSEKLVPGSEYSAKLELKNGGDVAFDYTVKIKLKGETSALAEQLKVYVNGVDKGSLSAYRDGVTVFSGAMAANDAANEFTVKIVFENSDNEVEQNNAQNCTASFDLFVEATQKTAEAAA